MLRETGVDAVMVGRRAWGRPWFFREVVADMRGEPVPVEPDWTARREAIERHFERLLALREREHLFRKSPPRPPKESASLAFRPHLLKYLRGTAVSGFVRRNLNEISSPEALHDVLARAETQA
jgi:tRNA-dihydrouridine synthase B